MTILPFPVNTWSYSGSVVVFDPMAGMAQGDTGVGTFQGTQICKHRLQVKFVMEGGSTSHDNVRAIVWVEKEFNGVTHSATLSGVLENTGADICNSAWSRDHAGTYKILYNRHYILTTGDQAGGTQVCTAAQPHFKYFNLDLKIPKRYGVSKWNKNLGCFITNRIFVGFCSDSAIAPHPGPANANGLSTMFYSA